MKKLIVIIGMFALAGVFSCSDNEPLKKETVAPPPTVRTIFVNAKKENSSLEQADVYYSVNSGTGAWTLLGSISSTSCTSVGSFSANDGDTVYFAILENSTSDGVSFWLRPNSASCPNSGTSTYCGNFTDGTDYPGFLVSANATISLTARVRTVANVNILWNCYF